MSLRERWDYNRSLTSQFPIASMRVLYAKAGTNPAAAILRGTDGIIENSLYWIPTDDVSEALYLTGVLNSEVLRHKAERYQAQGQWGARHFDKVMFNLPIPLFSAKEILHRDLAAVAKRAEEVAAGVSLREAEHFTRTRKRIRDALRASGISKEIDTLVARLLAAEG